MIRAAVDANVLISYLLHPTANTPPIRIIEAVASGQFHLVIPETLLRETADSVRTKPYHAARIVQQDVLDLETSLRLTATIPPELTEIPPRITRDPGDDYFLVHAVLEDLDVFVSGDKDLLELGEVVGLRIVSPAAFVAILGQSTE
jgi:uncharacterized protein